CFWSASHGRRCHISAGRPCPLWTFASPPTRLDRGQALVRFPLAFYAGICTPDKVRITAGFAEFQASGPKAADNSADNQKSAKPADTVDYGEHRAPAAEGVSCCDRRQHKTEPA